ncbi:fimbrial-like protein [Enterobacter quasiroggenkampii]|uniref:fimbrial-like protein n=1 Tax=Enterobacter quasiroggenkampii TaxID=2497436 RepID=UPI001F0CBD22|nr:fimbrial-like protein [Enterobacter quasiroggenkampii]
MRNTPLLIKKYRLLLAAISGFMIPASSHADGAWMDVNIRANIVANTCKINVSGGGQVQLPVVTRNWFFNTDGSNKYTAAQDAGGTRFTVQVADCNDISSGAASKLHFSFKPQSGSLATGNNQVFANDKEQESDGAKNVGLVIFSDTFHQNVLNQDGSSDVVYDVTSKQNKFAYLTDYDFSARYQNTGAVSTGRITSNVLVSVIYE